MPTKVVIFVLTILLSGCVTTTDSSFSKKEDKHIALGNYVQLGLAYIKKGDYERARKHLGRALDIDPESVGALGAMGLVYQNEGESSLAEEHFKKSLDIDPKFTLARSYYGAYLYAEGRYKEAYNQFELASNDTEIEARFQIFTNMAQCALKLDDTPDAIKLFEKSLKLNRYQPQVILSVIGLLIDNNNYAKAQRYFNIYLSYVRSGNVTHSPVSLYYGILLAKRNNDIKLEASYAMLLKNLYSDSKEYSKYRQLTADE